jgi:O-antigen ligase/Tfp pilus assembly protein PilF
MEQKEINIPNNSKSFWTKAIEISIIALVILVPVVFYPRCITVFIPAKEMIAEVLIVLGLMFWGLKIINKEELKFTPTPLNFPILSFISICVLSLIWSNSFFVSLKELPLFLAGPLLYFVITNSIKDERQINRILDILLIVGGLFGIYGIFQYNGIDFSFWTGNIGRQNVFGLFGNVNFFAEYLIIPLPVAVSLFFASQNKLKKILLFIGMITMGTSLTLTFTRGSYLGFGVSLIFMFFLFLISRSKNFIKNNKKIFIIALVAISIITFLFVVPTPLNKSGTVIYKIKSRISISQLTQDPSIKRRIATWKFTILMIKDHPLLGSGIGTYKYNTLKYQAEFFEQGENRSLYPHGFADKAHNEYLQLWAELGIIGLGIFIWLMFYYFNYGIKILNKIKNHYKQAILIGLMGSIIAILVDGIFGFPLHLPATIFLFWMALGLTIALGESEKEEKRPEIMLDNFNQKDKKEKERQGQKVKKDDKQSDIAQFTPILYILIISLSIFLCATLSRPFMAQVYWFYANKEIKNENWDKAIKISEEALKWDPYLGEVYYDIGKILEIKKFYGVSLEYFEKAAKYIDHPDLPQDLALNYLKKGQLDEAAIKLKQAISYQENEKSMLPLYAELGNTYLKLKRYKPAEIVLKDALKIDPNFINAHYGLAGAYLNQNKIEETLVELQKVIELAPDSQEAKNAQTIMQQIAQEKLKAQPEEKGDSENK